MHPAMDRGRHQIPEPGASQASLLAPHENPHFVQGAHRLILLWLSGGGGGGCGGGGS